MEYKYNTPNNVMFAFDPEKVNDPIKSEVFALQRNKIIKGVIQNGDWKVYPGVQWGLNNPSPGIFNIIHPYGHSGISFSMGLFEGDVGSINVVTMDDTHIEVNTRDSEGNLINKNFVFSLSLIVMAKS